MMGFVLMTSYWNYVLDVACIWDRSTDFHLLEETLPWSQVLSLRWNMLNLNSVDTSSVHYTITCVSTIHAF